LIQKNKSLSDLSTFGIGGKASYFTVCKSIDEMRLAYLFAREKTLPIIIVGKGSNTLFPDAGLDALVIQNRIDFLEIDENRAHVGAGYSFSLLGSKTVRAGLSGLEFASGIPASVGGAVFMNAGANGCETKDHLVEVKYLDEDGEVKTYSKEEMTFTYRKSSFQEMKGVIVGATFELTLDPEARDRQINIIEYRKKTQPLTEKSAGCVFRNPEGISASKLIDELGLKGKKVGGAMISPVHANFIVNTGNATQRDVLGLIEEVRDIVYKKEGVLLKDELRVIS